MLAHLFYTRGRQAEAPRRLALVTVVQFTERLSDRKVAEAVRTRTDLKYSRYHLVGYMLSLRSIVQDVV